MDRTETNRSRVSAWLSLVVLAGIVLRDGLGGWPGRGRRRENRQRSAAIRFPPAAVEFFEARVRPILVDQCVKCHGPKKQSSGLRLDSREAVLKGGDTGPAVVPGKPEESLLIQAVAHTHDELKMPPTGKLPEAAVATLAAMGRPGCTLAGRLGQVGEPRLSARAPAMPPHALGVPADQAGRRRRRSRTADWVAIARRCVRPGPARGGRD